MVSDPEFINKLSRKVGYNYSFGDEGMFLEEHNRSWELGRNKERSGASLSSQDRGIPADIEEYANKYMESRSSYNELFGV